MKHRWPLQGRASFASSDGKCKCSVVLHRARRGRGCAIQTARPLVDLPPKNTEPSAISVRARTPCGPFWLRFPGTSKGTVSEASARFWLVAHPPWPLPHCTVDSPRACAAQWKLSLIDDGVAIFRRFSRATCRLFVCTASLARLLVH